MNDPAKRPISLRPAWLTLSALLLLSGRAWAQPAPERLTVDVLTARPSPEGAAERVPDLPPR